MPAVQCSTPGRHVPVLLPQAPPPPGSISSTSPSQSSSRALHVSPGGSATTHPYSQRSLGSPLSSKKSGAQAPSAQAPATQAPAACANRQACPHVAQLSGSASKSTSSSSSPSQSLSRRSQMTSSSSVARQRY